MFDLFLCTFTKTLDEFDIELERIWNLQYRYLLAFMWHQVTALMHISYNWNSSRQMISTVVSIETYRKKHITYCTWVTLSNLLHMQFPLHRWREMPILQKLYQCCCNLLISVTICLESCRRSQKINNATNNFPEFIWRHEANLWIIAVEDSNGNNAHYIMFENVYLLNSYLCPFVVNCNI